MLLGVVPMLLGVVPSPGSGCDDVLTVLTPEKNVKYALESIHPL
jgi:hypothetical protein